MRVISTFLPAAPEEALEHRQTILLALDTLVDQKSLVVGLTVGRVAGHTLEDVTVSQPGALVIQRCVRHMDLNYPQGAVMVAGIAQVSHAPQRVRQVLTQAAPGSLVLLVCANAKVYDAVFPCLGINLQTLMTQAQ